MFLKDDIPRIWRAPLIKPFVVVAPPDCLQPVFRQIFSPPGAAALRQNADLLFYPVGQITGEHEPFPAHPVFGKPGVQLSLDLKTPAGNYQVGVQGAREPLLQDLAAPAKSLENPIFT